MDTSQQDPNTIGAVHLLNSIIRFLHQNESAGVSEIAEEIGRPTSTVHKYLKTLDELNLARNQNGTYRLSLSFFEFGGGVRERHPLFTISRDVVNELSEDISEMVWIDLRLGNYGIIAYNTIPYQGTKHQILGVKQVATLGDRYYLHQRGTGKAMLAELSDEKIKKYAQETGLPAAMEKTVSTHSELMEEVEAIRKNGYAVARGEPFEGIRTLSAAFRYRSSEYIGAMIIVVPNDEPIADTLVEEYADKITRAAGNISLELKYGGE
jgi:DNA-binding IclR family transcriptional regulator